ncbi:MAG TPA: CRTAC1 family protein [Planctomycetota bacterium]|nr:CRTAC1 family protein [Planctomycetota bacterium]
MSRGAPLRAAATLLLALVAACGDHGDAPKAAAAASGPGGFEERGEAMGIRFRMAFLPREQGEKFKINFYDHGCGVAAGDIDGDGDDDLYFLNQLGPNALYRNNGDGTFSDVTETAGLALDDRISVSAAFNDVDNDGDEDLFVTSTRGGNAFFRNDGKGRFTDATKEAGLSWVGHSQGGTFFDADGDGDLDLLLSNTAKWTTDTFEPIAKYYTGGSTLVQLFDSEVEYNVFYRNKGDGTFAIEQVGLDGAGWGGDCAVLDYDDDGDQDILVANMFGGSHLYRNDGKGRFENVTAASMGRTPWGAVAAKVLDYDGDGLLDVYIVDMHSDMWTGFDYDLSQVQPERKYVKFFGPYLDDPAFRAQRREELFAEKAKLPYGTTFFGNGLYRNLGNGKFEEVSAKAHAETFWPWGMGVADFDDDGYEDVFLASGMGYPWEFWPNAYLANNGDGTFTERARDVGLDPPPGGPLLGVRMGKREATKSSRACAVTDLDGDGRMDLVVNNFNDRAHVFMNRMPGRNWIGFRLTGTTSNRDAVGAVLRLHAGGRTRIAQVQAAGGYLSQSTKTVHFGLGDVASADSCEIRWPDGRVQTIEGPAINRVHAIVEPKP